MVRHQAIGPDVDRALTAPFGQQGNISTVVVVEEGLHPPVAPLGYVVGNACCYDACNSGHVKNLMDGLAIVKEQLSMVSPEFSLTGHCWQGEELPHEIGFFLGCPVKDVRSL
jgi:hypothetical protein